MIHHLNHILLHLHLVYAFRANKNGLRKPEWRMDNVLPMALGQLIQIINGVVSHGLKSQLSALF
jgi:hypothetical protein